MEPGSIDQAARRCPLCRGVVTPRQGEEGLECGGCGRGFPARPQGGYDFRLREGEAVRHQVVYRPLSIDRTLDVAARRETPCVPPRNSYAGDDLWHLTRDQITYIPQAGPGQLAMDLGCGTALHRPVLDALGYRYYGVDFWGDGAQDYVDAHALPVADATVDLILAIALLEHLAEPAIAMAEMARVLKPGGYAIGTVAFLEPFHDNSFFHFSPLGLQSALQTAGLVVDAIMAIRGWNVVRAQLEMGFERAQMPRVVTNLLSQPFVALMESYAALGRIVARDKTRHGRDIVYARHAGSLFYVARRAA
jgi:SAM-dependent methyltransferase